MGTMTGAKIAHFADAEPIKILTIQETSMSPMINGIPVKLISFSRPAPLIASTAPKFDQAK